MYVDPNTPSWIVRGSRWLGAPLLAFLLYLALLTPQANAADPVTEVTTSATSAVESVTTTASEAAATPPASPPEPVTTTASAAPAAATDVVATTASAVERSTGTAVTATVSHGVREVAKTSTEVVRSSTDAVAANGGATDLPVVKDSARQVADAVDSIGGKTDESGTDSALDRTSPAGSGDVGTTRQQQGAPQPGSRRPEGDATPAPSRPLQPFDRGRPLAGPDPGARTAAGTDPMLSVTAPDLQKIAGDRATTADSTATDRSGSDPISPLPSAPPIASPAPSSTGGGFGPLLLLLGVLALLSLTLPRIPPRLLRAGRIRRSAPFICALERPG